MAFGKQRNAALRQRIWDVLHFGKGRAGHICSYAIIFFILLSVAILPLEFMTLFADLHGVLITMEVVLTIIFTAEYVLRIYAAPSRLRYITSFYGIVDLFSILPFYLGFLGTQYVRIFRLARIVRLLKISRIEAAASVEKESAKEVGLLPGERVEHVVSRHPFIFMLGLFPVVVSTAFACAVLLFSLHPVAISVSATLFLFAFIFLYKAFLDFNFDVIYVTTHRLIFQNRHILGRNTNQVSYRAITNVKPQYTGIISYLLGFGSIVIETPAETGGKIEQKYVRSHEAGAQTIMKRCFQYQDQPEGGAPRPDPEAAQPPAQPAGHAHAHTHAQTQPVQQAQPVHHNAQMPPAAASQPAAHNVQNPAPPPTAQPPQPPPAVQQPAPQPPPPASAG